MAILLNLSVPGRSDHLNATNSTDIDCTRSNGTVAKTGSSLGPLFPGDSFSYQIDLDLGATFDGNSVVNIQRGIVDHLPAAFLLDSLVENEVAGSSITCSSPPTGSSGLVSCSLDNPLDDFEGSIDLFGHVADDALPGLLTNTASAYINASFSIGPISCLADATWQVQIISPANVTADKTVTGSFLPGGAITYLVVLTNSGPANQLDAPGNEFTDVLPAELDLDCDATNLVSGGGALGCSDGTNTVVWNGPIPADESVTLSIGATIVGGTPGVPIENQGSFQFDADGDGISESNGTTDDPGTTPAPDPTALVLGVVASDIPAAGVTGLMVLALLLAVAALPKLRE